MKKQKTPEVMLRGFFNALARSGRTAAAPKRHGKHSSQRKAAKPAAQIGDFLNLGRRICHAGRNIGSTLCIGGIIHGSHI